MTTGAVTPLQGPRVARAAAPAPLLHALALGLAGLAATAVGIGRLVHAVLDEPTVTDVAGVLVGVAGIMALVRAYRLALRGRGRLAKLAAVGATLALLQWVALPVVAGALAANAGGGPVDGASTLGLPGARDVRLRAPDGTAIAGWLVPGRSGAAVVVMHGSHGTREQTAAHVRLLSRAGFTVLSIDARGHGESSGEPNAAGWTSAPDIAGAVAFLRGQPGVDADRIGALGLSMGGEVALRAASAGTPLAAVVADGAGASTLGDQRLTDDGPLPTSVSWMTMRAAELFSGDREPPPLHRAVGAIDVPVLFVASRATGERETDEAFARRIGERAAVWFVADAGHTDALDVHPREYAARVASFLRTTLRGDRDGH